MNRDQWGKVFDRWYRHTFNIGMNAEGPSHEVIDHYFDQGMSPAEAVTIMKIQKQEESSSS
jgi:hypothetical protein